LHFLFDRFRLDRRGLFRQDSDGVATAVEIGSRALDVLRVLLERPGDLLSRDEIMGFAWPRMVVEDNNLTIQISTLRRVLDQDCPQGSCIQTVPRRGYRFVAPVTRVDTGERSAIQSLSDGGKRSPPRLSIVVLPFVNLSDDPDQQYFADGITEDVTTDLSRLANMFVISCNTAFTYRNKHIDTKRIGYELCVRYVLEGSVRRSCDRVRITTQLIDAEKDAHLWAERFDCDTGDLFALQTEITSRIANALGIELIAAEAARPTDNPDALEYILRGRAAGLKPVSRPPMPSGSACSSMRWRSTRNPWKRKACWQVRLRTECSTECPIRRRSTSRARKGWLPKPWRHPPAIRLRISPKGMCCARRADPRKPFPNTRRCSRSIRTRQACWMY
jgi:TolB-like protein